MGHRERSQVMKRSIVVIGIAGALLVAPSVASAASVPQVRSQVVDSQLVRSQLVRPQLVRPQLVRQQVSHQQVVRQVVRPGLVKAERASALRISVHLLQLR
jgi:hypothetical protein